MKKIGRPRIPDDARIAARWSHWLPWATITARKTSGQVSADSILACLRDEHAACCRNLLAAGLRWPVIARHSLDAPGMSHDARVTAVAAALERRRCRMGRAKQQVKSRYERNNYVTN
jgi:hypothetical protein